MFEHIKPLRPKVGVSAVCSPLEIGADRAPQAARDLARLLEAAGCEVVALDPVDTPDRAVEAGRKLAEAHVDAIWRPAGCAVPSSSLASSSNLASPTAPFSARSRKAGTWTRP